MKNEFIWQHRPTMDEFLNGRKEENEENKDSNIQFTGAWKCTLCHCPQYKGGDNPSDLCENCGHQRHKHVHV